jgi:hypothetical protein
MDANFAEERGLLFDLRPVTDVDSPLAPSILPQRHVPQRSQDEGEQQN